MKIKTKYYIWISIALLSIISGLSFSAKLDYNFTLLYLMIVIFFLCLTILSFIKIYKLEDEFEDEIKNTNYFK